MKKNWSRWIALGLTVGMLGVQAPVVHAEDLADVPEDTVVTEEQVSEEEVYEETESVKETKEEVQEVQAPDNEEKTEAVPEIDVVEETTEKYYDTESGKGTWKQSNGRWWFRFENGDYAKDGIWTIGGVDYAFDASGWMVTGWYKAVWSDGSYDWYYFKSNGAMKKGWLKDGGKWYYLDEEDGYMWCDRWSWIDGYWYKFRENGVMYTGWYKYVRSDGSYDWYYFDAKGREYRGWLKDGGKWYYFNEDEEDDDGWMYADDVYEIDGSYYAFGKNGAMLTGWQYFDEYECWAYFDSNGKGHNGWLSSGGAWYWCEDGVMFCDGIVKIGDKWSEFGADGKWLGYVDAPV